MVSSEVSRDRIRWTGWIITWTASIVVGCTHPSVTRFANEFDCPEGEVEMQDLGARTYRLRGCGHQATYVCLVNAYNEGICSLDTQPVHEESAAPVATSRERPPARAPSPRLPVSGTATIDGQTVPSLRFSVGGLPVIFAPRPRSSPPSFAVAASPTYDGQGERCERLDLSTGDRSVARVERLPQAQPRYLVDASAIRELVNADAIQISVCNRTVWLSRPQRGAFAAFYGRSQRLFTSGPNRRPRHLHPPRALPPPTTSPTS